MRTIHDAHISISASGRKCNLTTQTTFPHVFLLPARLSEKSAEHFSALFSEHAAHHFRLVVEPLFLQEIHQRSCTAPLGSNAPNTTLSTLESTTAPAHIGHGSKVT